MRVDYAGRTSCGCPYINQPDPAKHWKGCHFRLNAEAQAGQQAAASPVEPVGVISSCPFCKGEATPLVLLNATTVARVDRQDSYGCDGVDVVSLVQCSYCDAKGPEHIDVIFSGEGYDKAVAAAIALWSVRDARGLPA
ncbi:TPA: hypothetical protein N2C61_003521 [Pseudomonas aeruginosa]|nr:hypothetical protein [Pseudomonas aeruginosa]